MGAGGAVRGCAHPWLPAVPPPPAQTRAPPPPRRAGWRTLKPGLRARPVLRLLTLPTFPPGKLRSECEAALGAPGSPAPGGHSCCLRSVPRCCPGLRVPFAGGRGGGATVCFTSGPERRAVPARASEDIVRPPVSAAQGSPTRAQRAAPSGLVPTPQTKGDAARPNRAAGLRAAARTAASQAGPLTPSPRVTEMLWVRPRLGPWARGSLTRSSGPLFLVLLRRGLCRERAL